MGYREERSQGSVYLDLVQEIHKQCRPNTVYRYVLFMRDEMAVDSLCDLCEGHTGLLLTA